MLCFRVNTVYNFDFLKMYIFIQMTVLWTFELPAAVCAETDGTQLCMKESKRWIYMIYVYIVVII